MASLVIVTILAFVGLMFTYHLGFLSGRLSSSIQQMKLKNLYYQEAQDGSGYNGMWKVYPRYDMMLDKSGSTPPMLIGEYQINR